MTWQELEKEINNLSVKINIMPDIIVAVVRGGLIPARLLATTLHVKEMYSLTVEKFGDRREVTSEIKKEFKGKRILLVEDILETGKSLLVAKQYLEAKGAVVRTACFYSMPQSEITPDYSLKQVDRIITFPWEKIQ